MIGGIFPYLDDCDSPCCKSPQYTSQDGFRVCVNCGTIIDKIYESTPRRVYSMDDIKSRKHSEAIINPIGPRTQLSGKTDIHGHTLNPEAIQRFKRLNKIHRTMKTSVERNLTIAIPKIKDLQNKFSLPSQIIEDTIRIYRWAVEARMAMGRSIEILIAASVIASLKIHKIARISTNVLKILDVPPKKVMKTYRQLVLTVLKEHRLQTHQTDSADYIQQIGEVLGMPMKIIQFADKILKYAKNNGLMMEGKDPRGFAAAALYMAAQYSKVQLTQKVLSKSSDITEVTLRSRFRELKKIIPLNPKVFATVKGNQWK